MNVGLSINTAGVPAFLRDLDLALAVWDRQISAAFAGWTKKMFTDLVKNTPQWSGDLAANWKYTLHTPSASYTPIPNKVEGQQYWSKVVVHQRGSSEAVGMALAQLTNVAPTWRDVVYFTNNTPIADKVSRHVVLIRPINLIDDKAVFMLDMLVLKAQRGAYVP